MNIVLWGLAALLALVFLAAGGTKLARTPEQLVASGMGWADGVPAAQVKALGALEVLGALGLVLPAATGIATVLTPLAAVGLAIVMVGGAVVHARRGELPGIAITVVLLVLCVVVAWGRFGPYAFA